MRRGRIVQYTAFWFAALLSIALADSPPEPRWQWQNLPPLPAPLGLGGPMAGVSGNALLVAGGSNFPEPAPLGTKVWYDDIYLLPSPGGEWKALPEKLPRPLGYGVSFSTPDGLICAGGSNAEGHFRSVFRLEWNGVQLTRTDLPDLPTTCANSCGAQVGNTLYLAGGLESPNATTTLKTFWALDLAAANLEWKALPTWPGPGRMLAVAGSQEGSFFLLSGTDLNPGANAKPERVYLTDAYRYAPGEGWRKLRDLPQPVVAAPSPALALGSSHLLVCGGDDGRQVNIPLGEPHAGFSRQILAYHTITDTWIPWGSLPAGHVTTAAVNWQGKYVVPSGEIRPGVRTPNVLSGKLITERAAFGWINLATLALYPVLMLSIGLYYAWQQQNTQNYFRGGERIPWWAAGLSIYATMLSSITFMSVPAKSFATHWGFFLNYFTILLLTPIITSVYLPFFRRLNVTSAYEYLELRFNLVVRLFGSASFILFQIGRTGIVLYLPALALATVSDIDLSTCIIGMGLLCILMTVFGGMEAVIWTDVAQAILLLAAALISLLWILFSLQGGWSDLFTTAAAHGKFFENVPWNWNLTIATGWVILWGNFFSNFISYTANQEVIQRYLTTADEKQAAQALWVNAIISIPSGLLFFLVGTALYVFYFQHPERLDPTVGTEAIFPLFMVHELPAGIAGLVVAGIFAAAQPTSGLNSAATAVVTDFATRLCNQTSETARMRVARVTTVVVGILGTLVALTMARYQVQQVWDAFLDILGLTTGILAGLFSLGLLARRANGAGACGAILITALVLVVLRLNTPLHFLLYGGIGVLVSFGCGYLLSLLFVQVTPTTQALTLWTLPAQPAPPVETVEPD